MDATTKVALEQLDAVIAQFAELKSANAEASGRFRSRARAVIVGGVLEEHVRKLCDANGISTVLAATGKNIKLDTLNAELARADVYSKNDQKQITAWCGIRNSAAHAKYDEFDEHQVRAMIEGIRGFISRYPAWPHLRGRTGRLKRYLIRFTMR